MKVHELNGYIQNIFIVEEHEQLLLLDGCSRSDVNLVCRYIQHELKQPLSALKTIVVTHMHPDHAGGAHELKRRSGARLVCHPNAPTWYSGLAGRSAHMIDVALAQWVAKRIGKPRKPTWYNPILKPDQVLQDEASVPHFPNWQVLYTPGHTDHDISLHHLPTNTLYIADVLVKVKSKLVPPYPLCHPNQYQQSLRRIKQVAPQTLLFAHLAPMCSKDIDFDHITTHAPKRPANHWRVMKSRLKRKFTRRQSHK